MGLIDPYPDHSYWGGGNLPPHRKPPHNRILALISSLVIVSTVIMGASIFIPNSHANPFDTGTPISTNTTVLVVPNMEVIAIPDTKSLKQVKINQSMKITVELTTKNNHAILSQLEGSFGQSNSSLQQLLGDHNIACMSVYLYADPDQFNIEPTQAQEYPLNQTSIIWSWIVTPKQTGANYFDISFSAAGKSACTVDEDPVVGPYSLLNEVSYFYTVTGPNSTLTPTATSIPTTNPAVNTSNTPEISPSTGNIFEQIYNELGISTIITGVLTTLLAAFVTWICTQIWKRRKDKTKAYTHSKIPVKPDPSSLSKRSKKKGSRRSRKKQITVKGTNIHP